MGSVFRARYEVQMQSKVNGKRFLLSHILFRKSHQSNKKKEKVQEALSPRPLLSLFDRTWHNLVHAYARKANSSAALKPTCHSC